MNGSVTKECVQMQDILELNTSGLQQFVAAARLG
jgi:hypothetical protein